MATPLEYFLHRNYSKEIKTWLNEILNLSRYPKDKQPFTVYMTPARAFARFIMPTANGQPDRPIVTFHLNGYEYLPENILGFETEKVFFASSNITRIIRPPLIHRLTFGVAIYTVLQGDMDILLYQILSNSSKNRKAARRVDGQWMEIMSTDPRDETNLEPGDAQDKVIRFGLDLVVPRAYLPQTYEEVKSIVTTDVIDKFEVTDVGDTTGGTKTYTGG